ncbi:Toll-like receptor 6 [Armadillidium vulgare]|nr:Toll-like receptor 6 [Armadillidium vulgare]
MKGLESLTSLSIQHCNLTSIPSKSFASLGQLKQLKINSFIDGNESRFLEIREDAIPENLELIDLSFNNMKSFPPTISCDLLHLNLLILSNNRIDSVDKLGFFKIDLNPNENKENEDKRDINLHENQNIVETEGLKEYNKSFETETKLPEKSNATEILSAKAVRLNNINSNIYTPCFRSLRSLSLNENDIKELPSGSFNTLSQLEYLYLAKNDVRNLSSQAFFGLFNLQVLDLSGNLITFIGRDTFSKCHLLEKLYLNNNSISILSNDIFDRLSELQILDLSFNNLTMDDSHEETFSGLRRLVILNLSHNKIPTLFSSVFNDLTSLQKLDISFNDLSFIEENTFTRMFNLYELDLSNNKIESLSSTSFAGLVGLNILNLSRNSLKNLHSNILHQSSNLKQILLSNNNFEELPSAVQNLSFLNYLDMSQNKILTLEFYDFKRLSNLHVFNLSSNLLKNISKSTFNSLQSLRVLDISDNNIESIKEGSLDSIKDLNVLKLSRNKLGNINGLFAGMEYLEELDLSENNINMFDYAFLPRQLLKLLIRKNNVKQLGNYYKVHRVLALEDIDASFNRIKEISEESLPNSIRRVSLEQNILYNVKPGTFTEKINIEYINFRMNQISKLNPKSISPKWITEKQKEGVYNKGQLPRVGCGKIRGA